MGCDIHLYVEKKENNNWKAVNGPYEEEAEDYMWLSHWQHYNSFAVLCGVRNYSNIKPIADPKGFPDDASELVKEEYNYWGENHSASWLTLNELMSVDWDFLVKNRYYLPEHIAEAKLKGEEPFAASHTRSRDSDVLFEDEEKLSDFAYHIPMLIQELKKKGAPDQVRIVFWFDN